MPRILLSVFACGLLVAITSFPCIAQSSEKDSLRGLKGIYVLVERIGGRVEQQGLTTSQLKTDAELKLRKAGIRVATRGESLDSSVGTLHISVTANPTQSVPNLYQVSIIVELLQEVRLVRDPTITVVSATTYAVARSCGTVGIDHLRDDVRNAASDDVDVFINDYLAMNPKP
jgi:hypothetical protein